ncbi:hypothetical protein [Nocardioides sp. SYSU DS0651]|uniref:hypothetical protein n=1 Tax=Nocardioides sp. SYSU DS0651 TaxID=3415955 RepID=UPI003F4C7FAC
MSLLLARLPRPERLLGRLPRPEVLLGRLLVAHVVLKLLVFPLVVHSPPFGDETAYVNGGMALSNLVRDLFALREPDLAEVERNVVASGWFMPGMSVLLAPLYLLFPEAPTWLLRGYLGGVTLLLVVAAVRAVARRFGAGWACVALVPGLVPSWVVLTYGAYGDLVAGLVLVLLLMHLATILDGFRRGAPPSLREGAVLGLLAIVVLYLRSSTSVLLAGLGVLAVVTAMAMLRGRARLRAAGSAAVAAAVFAVLLAPWSAYASHSLGSRVLTTTTVPTVLATTFGDPSEICFGGCDPDSTVWFRPVRYAREVGRATGTSEVEVLKVMSDHALRDLTVGEYLDQAIYNLGAYSLQPTNFTGHLAPPEGRGPVGRAGERAADVVTWVLYVPLVALGAASLLAPVRRSLRARVLDVLVKLSLGGLLVQPFVHLGGGRYWTTAGLLFALGAGSLVRERQAARDAAAPAAGSVGTDGAVAAEGLVAAGPAPRDAGLVRWLGRVQLLLRALTGLVVAVLVGALLV